MGDDGAAGAPHVRGLPRNCRRTRHAHRSSLAIVGVWGIRDRRRRHYVHFVAFGAGHDWSAGELVDLRDPRLTVGGRQVPLEATPPFFRWLAEFEPMHQVFLGTRSLLYLKGHADTGLSQALTMTTVGLVIGLLLGGVIYLYDRKGFHRIPGAAEMAIAAEHQAQHQARQSKREQVAEPEPESSSEQT